VFSVTTALVIGDQTKVSVIVPAAEVVAVLAALAMIRSLQVKAFASIQLAPTLAAIAGQGRGILDDLYRRPCAAARRPAAPLPPRRRGVTWPNRQVTLQQLDLGRLLHAADGAVIVLRAAIGDTLQEGTPVADLHGGEVADAAVLGGLVTGQERTFHQDPLFAFRLLADIGLRALSAAVNDPATAVQPDGAAAPAIMNLAAECGLATSVLSGLVDQAGARFSGRVLVLAAGNLDGLPPAGELGGDDVLVLTPFVPSAAAAAAAQQNLIAAGAARAAVLGPEATPAELDQIVTDGLGLRQVTETVTGPVLFANHSAVLLPAGARVLAPLAARLEQPGVTAVVNGYASAPGSAHYNQQLSENRAAAVARYLEAHGVSAAGLFVIGHGARNFVAPGSSGDNRRVVVVIEEPTDGA
jgi:outer membrane protein OmpA-like peptidoglycan-associated protein